jgi:hypothetical protein
MTKREDEKRDSLNCAIYDEKRDEKRDSLNCAIYGSVFAGRAE